MTKVSIITPSYNRANYIETTIKSVLNQTYNNIEYIVVDGNSNDTTKNILEKYAERNLLSYISEPDTGMYDAINKGLSMATGDILAYINTDDYYFPWTVSRVVEAFQKSETDLVFGDCLVNDLANKASWINIYPRFTNRYLRVGHLIPQPTVFFKRNVFETVGAFGKNVNLLADCEYWLRSIDCGFVMSKINEVLAVECNHGDTLRNKFLAQIDAEKALLIKTYNRSCSNQPLIRSYKFLKYIQKEFYYLCFALSLNMCKSTSWSNFKAHYYCKIFLVNYMLAKFQKSPDFSEIWQIKHFKTGPQ